MNDERLLRHYLEMKGPEAGEWNASPRSLLMEFTVRDFVSRKFPRFAGMKVCNVGIGTGDDIVTIIGSTILESGGFTGCLDACFRMIKPGGSLMLMAIEKFTSMNRVEEYIRQTDFLLLRQEINETFPDLSFYIYQVEKRGATE